MHFGGWSGKFWEYFSSFTTPCGLGRRFFKKIIFLYEISAALVYMGEMSTLTTPPRKWNPFWRRFAKFLWKKLFSLTTGHEDAVLTDIEEIFSLHFPLRMRSAFFQEIRKLFWEIFSSFSSSRILQPLSLHYRGIENDFFNEIQIFIWKICHLRLHRGNVNPL